MEVEVVVGEGSPAQGTREQRLEANRLFWGLKGGEHPSLRQHRRKQRCGGEKKNSLWLAAEMDHWEHRKMGLERLGASVLMSLWLGGKAGSKNGVLIFRVEGI